MYHGSINRQSTASSSRSHAVPLPRTVVGHREGYLRSFSRLNEDARLEATIKSRSKSKAPLSARIKAEATDAPLQVFKSLIDVLLEGRIPGPRLLRLREEFKTIGSGRTFQVLAASEECRQRADDIINNNNNSELGQPLRQLKSIAVKRALASNDTGTNSRTSTLLSEHDITRTFGRQLSYIYYEIDALCRAPFRHHPNIVKLLSWGLCLDTLEASSADDPRIPLLLLERAEWTLGEFLRTESVVYENLRSICFDVGRGLHAIHREGWVHGDLKLDNILLFKEGGKLVPKICDFGLSQSPQDEEAPYRGSSGWAPLKGSQRLAPGHTQQCDIFAYGLIIWSIFTEASDSPLPAELWDAEEKHLLLPRDRAYGEHKIYYTAKQSVQASSVVPAEEVNRILIVLRDALHGDPRLWRQQPWTYFNANKYPTIPPVDDTATPLMSLARAMSKYSNVLKTLIIQIELDYSLLYAIYLTKHVSAHIWRTRYGHSLTTLN